MTYLNDSSTGAANRYYVSTSETFVSNFADTIGIESNNNVDVRFANAFNETRMDPVISIRDADTVTFAESSVNPSFITNATVSVIADSYLTFSDEGRDTVSVDSQRLAPSANMITFNGPSDVLYESGADDFVKQGWESGNMLVGAMQNGVNDTIVGGLDTAINMLFENDGVANNLFLAPGHTGTTSITIGGGHHPLDGETVSGYTIENVNPALDQFNIGSAQILSVTVADGNSYIDISGGVDLVFKGYTGPADALFVGYHAVAPRHGA
jgi:hypothetical protein